MVLDADGLVQAHLNPAENPLRLPYSPDSEDENALLKRAMNTRESVVFSSDEYSRDGFVEGVVPLFSDQKYMGVVRVRLSVAGFLSHTNCPADDTFLR